MWNMYDFIDAESNRSWITCIMVVAESN